MKENIVEETWKPVPAPYEEFEASNLGNLKKNGKLLKLRPNRCGYVRVKVNYKKHNQKSIAAHRLIASAFFPNANNNLQVDHINGNKADNRIMNLEWVTPGENIHRNWNFRKANNIKPQRRKVICVENKIIYDSVEKAAEACNIHKKRIYDALVGIQKTAGGYSWKFVEE